jgi:ribokinase
MSPRVVVETLGADGSLTTTRHDSFHTPAFRVNVVNTTGAGDVFHGAYLVGLLEGWDAKATALFASAAAALTCTSLGGPGRIPSSDAVRTFLARQGISLPRTSDAEPSIRD